MEVPVPELGLELEFEPEPESSGAESELDSVTEAGAVIQEEWLAWLV